MAFSAATNTIGHDRGGNGGSSLPSQSAFWANHKQQQLEGLPMNDHPALDGIRNPMESSLSPIDSALAPANQKSNMPWFLTQDEKKGAEGSGETRIGSSLLAPTNPFVSNCQPQQQQPQHPDTTAAAFASALENGNAAGGTTVSWNHHHHSSLLHNLIPSHLQSLALAPSLNGTPGHPSALIPPPSHHQHHPLSPGALITAAAAAGVPILSNAGIPLTVQDRPMTSPVYNGVNPNYPGLRVVNNSPPIFCVENFLTPFECDFLIQVAQDSFGPAPVVGKGAGEVSPSRTSSTCYLAREDLPDLLRKVSILTGKPIDHCELPQVGRYFPTQQYLQHFDAFDLSTEDGCRFAANGGQRTITVLIYLNDVLRGGATRFPALNLEVQPRRGMALVFFPATVDGMLDKMALHAALPAIDTKYVSQCWIRQSTYNGTPSKRLPATLGTPFGMTENNNPVQTQMQHLPQAPHAAFGGLPQQHQQLPPPPF